MTSDVMTHDDGLAAAARLAALERQHTAARHQVDRLMARTRVVVGNGVDLRDPERAEDFARDQVSDAITGAVVTSGCVSGIANGDAATALITELARRLAEAER